MIGYPAGLWDCKSGWGDLGIHERLKMPRSAKKQPKEEAEKDEEVPPEDEEGNLEDEEEGEESESDSGEQDAACEDAVWSTALMQSVPVFDGTGDFSEWVLRMRIFAESKCVDAFLTTPKHKLSKRVLPSTTSYSSIPVVTVWNE